MQPTAAPIPDILVGISPVIVAALAGWLGQAHFPAWANALICGVVILAVSCVAVFVAGLSFTNNLVEDFVLISAYVTAFTYGPFRPLMNYLILGPSSQLPAVRQEQEQISKKGTAGQEETPPSP